MVELEIFRKKDIPEMLNDARLWNQDFLATTKQRLNVHYNNPAMDDVDVVLIVAWYETNMIGYIGGFSDFVSSSSGYEKITWLHSWWMNPEYRFTKAGLMLFEKIYEACNGRIGISQFTPSAGRIYDKSGKFNVLTVMNGGKLIIRLQLIRFIKEHRKKTIKVLIPFGWIVEKLINSSAIIIQKLAILIHPCPKAEFLANLDSETEMFIKKHQPNPICNRDKLFFDFLYHNNVILQTVTPSTTDDRYFFSHRAERFGFFFIKVPGKDKTIKAFMVLQMRDGVLKLLYAFYENDAIEDCVRIIAHHIHRLNSHTFILYDEKILKAFQQKRMLYLLFRKKEKEVLISKSFAPSELWNTSKFNYGDGDCCFA